MQAYNLPLFQQSLVQTIPDQLQRETLLPLQPRPVFISLIDS